MGEDRSRYDREDPAATTQRHLRPRWRSRRWPTARRLPRWRKSTTCISNQVTQWRRQLLECAAGVFGGAAAPEAPAVDLKALHAKIGQL